MMIFISHLLHNLCPCVVLCLYSCGRLWFVGDVVMVHYVDAVSVMRVLLFGLHVCMLRECEGSKVMDILVWVKEEVWLW